MMINYWKEFTFGSILAVSLYFFFRKAPSVVSTQSLLPPAPAKPLPAKPTPIPLPQSVSDLINQLEIEISKKGPVTKDELERLFVGTPEAINLLTNSKDRLKGLLNVLIVLKAEMLRDHIQLSRVGTYQTSLGPILLVRGVDGGFRMKLD